MPAHALSVAVPVKAGFSLSNYYELDGTDHPFGFLSVAGVVTVPLGVTTKFGGWNVHGGVEFQKLGDATASFNGGDRSKADRVDRDRILLLEPGHRRRACQRLSRQECRNSDGYDKIVVLDVRGVISVE